MLELAIILTAGSLSLMVLPWHETAMGESVSAFRALGQFIIHIVARSFSCLN